MKFALWAGLALAILAPAAGLGLSAAGGRDVVVVSPHSREVVEINRLLWAKGERVPELYGIPHGSMRVLFPGRRRLVVPEEDPSVTLLLLDPDERPFQERTLWFFVRWATVTGVLLLLVGFLQRLIRSRRP